MRDATALPAEAAIKAITRLVSAGLVMPGAPGELVLAEAAFARAARAGAHPRPGSDDDFGNVAAHEANVLRRFVRHGRLTSIPVARRKRRVVLEWLSQQFEPGRRYSEAMVNLTLGQVHPDTAALRRYLVDEGFLDRAHGEY